MKLKDLVIKGGLQIGPFGSQLKASEYTEGNDGIPVIMPKDMQNGKIFDVSIARISADKAEKLKRHKLKAGDIVFGRRGEIGRCGLVTQKEEGWICGSGCLRARLSNLCSPEFIAYQIQTPSVVAWLESNAVGQTMLNLNTTILGDLSLDVPPIAEQKRIVEILEVWDGAIAIVEQLITAKQKLKKASLSKLLTGRLKLKQSSSVNSEVIEEVNFNWKRIKDNVPDDWQVVSLADVATKEKHAIVDGPFGSNLKTEHYRKSGIPVIQSGFVTANKFVAEEYKYVDEKLFESQKRSKVVSGDIVMAKIGAQAGTCAILPENHKDSIIAGNCLKISLDLSKCLPEYVLAWLHYLYSLNQLVIIKSITAQPAISLSQLKRLKFLLPPIDEQKQIVDLLRLLDQEIHTLGSLSELLIRQKQGLMQKLLTGEWRVPVKAEVAA